ncbi:MAG TPA: HNH endonuclease, partial [Intrasporangium sp.]|nr:HNH endonuclease [Intrasporangium sp.]
PWPRGQTTPTDLSAKHRRHHNLRTTGAWTAERAPTGQQPITWRTLAGRRYTTWPKDWLEAHRQQPHHDAATPTTNHDRHPPPEPPDDPPPF